MRHKTAFFQGVCGLLMLLSFLLSDNAHGKPTVIKVATLAPEGSVWARTFEELNAEITEATGGQVRIKLYSGGVLGDEKDMIRKMLIGQIQGVSLTATGLGNLNKEMDVFQVPFLFETYDEVDYVQDRISDQLTRGFKENGYTVLGWSEAGFVRLMSTVPVATLEALQKAKVWTWEDAPMAKAIFDAAGVAAIPLSVPDVLVGLQTGLVDVVYAPPAGAISLQWFTKVKYVTDVPLVYLLGAVVVPNKVFKRLSPAQGEIVLNSFHNYEIHLKNAVRAENREALEVMAKQGITILKPGDAQLAKFKKLSDQAMSQPGTRSFSDAIMADVFKHLTHFRGTKP